MQALACQTQDSGFNHQHVPGLRMLIPQQSQQEKSCPSDVRIGKQCPMNQTCFGQCLRFMGVLTQQATSQTRE